MPLAVATWFDLWPTWYGILLALIGHQKSGTHFSKKKLKYFKILISGAICDFPFWATWIWQLLAQMRHQLSKHNDIPNGDVGSKFSKSLYTQKEKMSEYLSTILHI